VDAKAIGHRIRSLREGANLSQRNVVAETGISQTTLSRIENGESLPRVDQAVSLAWALGCPVEMILEDNPIRNRVLCATRANQASADVSAVKENLIFFLEMDAHLAAHGIGV
jgi:transcriptional regulator with XRE-family HTH domain